MGGQRHAPVALPPPQKKRAPVPTVQEAGWAPSPLWTGAENGKSLSPAGVQTQYSPARRQSQYR